MSTTLEQTGSKPSLNWLYRQNWFLDTTPIWGSVGILGIYTLLLLGISLWRVQG